MSTDPLELARGLLAVGVPVVVCRPNPDWQPGSTAPDVLPPAGWNTISANEVGLSTFRPGVDTLAMVGGHGVDVVDIDSKAGASPDDLPAFAYYGLHRTPSGGWHYLVPSTGYAKLSPFIVDGKAVGDYVGGTVHGGGRMLAYLPGSTRPKYAGQPYTVEHPLSLGAVTSSDPDPVLLELLDAAHGRRDTLPGSAARSSADVDAFLTAHQDGHHCRYGRTAVAGMLEAADAAERSQGGRHGWTVRSTTRLVELMRAGCATADDVKQLRATLRRIKPEGGTDLDDVLRWALANATGESGCTMLAQRAEQAGTLAPFDPVLDAQQPAVDARPTQLDDTVHDEPEPTSTWLPVDLAAVLDGTHEPEHATLLPRTDGVGLLYPGRMHSLHGESESGKSLAAQAEAARVLVDGGAVLYVDFESDHASVVGRLLALGAPREALRHRLDYVRPDASLRALRDREAFAQLLARPYALAVVDGVTEALALLSPEEGTPEERVVEWVRTLPRRIARRTGAAVVQVDHVTKSTDARGRFALGSQHKMNAIDGAAYTVEVVEPLGLGLRGVIALRVAKDRPGTVRPHCGAWRKSDRTQEAARVVVDATTPGRSVVTVEPPATRVGTDHDDPTATFRPTLLMERVSRYLEGMLEPVSGRAVTDNVQGKAPAIRTALDVLVDEGKATRTPGPRGSYLHASVEPYRQALDPRSDVYAGGDALNPFEVVLDPVTATATASPSKTGDAGRSQVSSADRVPGRTGTQSGRTGTQSLDDPQQDHLAPATDAPSERAEAVA